MPDSSCNWPTTGVYEQWLWDQSLTPFKNKNLRSMLLIYIYTSIYAEFSVVDMLCLDTSLLETLEYACWDTCCSNSAVSLEALKIVRVKAQTDLEVILQLKIGWNDVWLKNGFSRVTVTCESRSHGSIVCMWHNLVKKIKLRSISVDSVRMKRVRQPWGFGCSTYFVCRIVVCSVLGSLWYRSSVPRQGHFV